jgi:hypothetical protein
MDPITIGILLSGATIWYATKGRTLIPLTIHNFRRLWPTIQRGAKAIGATYNRKTKVVGEAFRKYKSIAGEKSKDFAINFQTKYNEFFTRRPGKIVRKNGEAKKNRTNDILSGYNDIISGLGMMFNPLLPILRLPNLLGPKLGRVITRSNIWRTTTPWQKSKFVNKLTPIIGGTYGLYKWLNKPDLEGDETKELNKSMNQSPPPNSKGISLPKGGLRSIPLLSDPSEPTSIFNPQIKRVKLPENEPRPIHKTDDPWAKIDEEIKDLEEKAKTAVSKEKDPEKKVKIKKFLVQKIQQRKNQLIKQLVKNLDKENQTNPLNDKKDPKKIPGPRKPIATNISAIQRAKIESGEVKPTPKIPSPRKPIATNISAIQRAKIESGEVKPTPKIPSPRKLVATKVFPIKPSTIEDSGKEPIKTRDLKPGILRPNKSLSLKLSPDQISYAPSSQLQSYFGPEQEGYNNSTIPQATNASFSPYQQSNNSPNIYNFGGFNITINSDGANNSGYEAEMEEAAKTARKTFGAAFSDNEPLSTPVSQYIGA